MQQQSTAGFGLFVTVIGTVGIALYLVVGFFYLSSGLVVPGPWLIVLWGIWLVGIYPLIAVYRRRRAWTPIVAVASALVWWLYVTIGEAVLGWTA